MKQVMIKRVWFIVLFVLSITVNSSALSDKDEFQYFNLTVYQMSGEGLDMEKVSAMLCATKTDTVFSTTAGIHLRNNTDHDLEIVNATLLITEKSEIDRLNSLYNQSKYMYYMEMVRKRYEKKWYRRLEYNGADKTPTVVKAGEEEYITFINSDEYYPDSMNNIACLLQVYAVPK